jgi:hypothetical protein
MHMATCITCGSKLHPERAEKYTYCLDPACQAENATGLTMVAVGINKSAEQYEVLDERTRQAMADGRFHDQRRALFGSAPTSTDGAARATASATATAGTVTAGARKDARTQSAPIPPLRTPTRRPWTHKQEKLALIYHEQGMRPDEIAKKIGLSRYTVTQIILGARPGSRR